MTRGWLRLKVAAAGLLVVLPCQASAQDTGTRSSLGRAAEVALRAGFSGEIAITDARGGFESRVMGMADREARRPHRPGERWLWASVTKQVTAVLVMQEVERGRLHLERRLDSLLPAFSGHPNGAATVLQLLQHQSGLADPDETPPAEDGIPSFYRESGRAIGDSARATGFCRGTPRAAPGAGFRYDNCDYLVLAAILEAVTGSSYAQLVHERIASKQKGSRLRLAPDGAPRGGAEMKGYDGPHPHPPVNVATYGGAGALTGSAADLAAFDRALLNDELLSPASRARLWKGEPAQGFQALGAWSFEAPLSGCAGPVALVERRGDVGGVQVRNVIAPGLGRAVILFTNDASREFGEVWQGRGLLYDVLVAALCPAV